MNYDISEKPFYKGSLETSQHYHRKCKKKTELPNYIEKIVYQSVNSFVLHIKSNPTHLVIPIQNTTFALSTQYFYLILIIHPFYNYPPCKSQ